MLRWVLPWVLPGDSHGGLGPEQAEQAAGGRHLRSTDLLYSDDRGEMLERVGQKEGSCYWVFWLVCGLSAGADPRWHEWHLG